MAYLYALELYVWVSLLFPKKKKVHGPWHKGQRGSFLFTCIAKSSRALLTYVRSYTQKTLFFTLFGASASVALPFTYYIQKKRAPES